MKYSIGLDLGINNVGWAVYDFDKKEIIDKGVVKFKASDSAENRRGVRSARRLNKRKHHRVERLSDVLKQQGFNTTRSFEPDLIEKRILGLNNKLDEAEISNLLYYFAIHRGYIPFDDEKNDRDVHEFGDNEYPCNYIYSFYKENGKYKGKCDLILMKDNLRELKDILLNQAKYYKNIDEEFINKVIDIISSKREFWEGPGAPLENQLSPYGRYRNLCDLEKYKEDNNYHKYLYEMLIGKDQVSMDIFGNMDNVAPKMNYFAEEFNFFNDFINMSVIAPNMLDSEHCGMVDFKTGKFTENTILEFKDYILTHNKINFKKMIKEILNVELSDIQGYRINKKGEPEISKFDFYKYLIEKFKSINYNPSWLYDNDKIIYNKIIYCLTVAPSSLAIEDILKDRVSEISFSVEEIEVLKEIKNKKNSDLKYHSLSERILKRTLKDMEKTSYQWNYMKIMREKNYEKELKEYFQNNYTKKMSSPYFIEDQYIDDIIANPQVKKTLRKAIKVINKIIETYKDYPYVIQIESAKEMNGKDLKKQIENEQKNYEKLNDFARKTLQAHNVSLTSKHIDQVINWQETNCKCAYCGKPISVSELLTLDYEHILPKAKTMDSTKENTTCACEKCNREKGERTPWEYLTSKNIYEEYKHRVINEFKVSEKKRKNLLFEGDIEKYGDKFVNRNLRDTAYGTISLIEELNKYKEFLFAKEGHLINIVSSPGQLTHRIRTNLELNNKDRDYMYHHVIDAMILASLADTRIGEVLINSQNDSKYWIEKKKTEKNLYNNVYSMIESVHLNNSKEIKDLYLLSENEVNKDKYIKISPEVLKNPLREFSHANYVKYIKRGNDFYKISKTQSIYDMILKTPKDRQDLEALFDLNNKTKVLLCEEKDKKLFKKLKEIYENNKNSTTPFKDYCLYKEGLENKQIEFNYLKHGIRKTDDPNSPIVTTLRYMEKVNMPYIKTLKQKRKNVNREFIETKQKENNLIGLDSMAQYCTSVYYSYDDKKFVFMPIYAICIKNGKIDETNQYYKQVYQEFVGNKKVKKMFDLYCGNVISAVKKSGEFVESKFSTYNKANNILTCKWNEKQQVQISTSSKQIIVYDVDILGNKKILFDTDKLI